MHRLRCPVGRVPIAAAIMIVVFGAFAFGADLLIKVLGFTLAAAVLFDATIVRVAVGPALLTLAGRWNWWPGDRGGPVRENVERGQPSTRSAAQTIG